MNTFECIRKCRVVRAYKDKKIPEEVVKKILEAGRYTSSARNWQAWHFIAITNREVLEKIGSLSATGRFIAQAPLAVTVVTNPSTPFSETDGARAIQNMTLAAWEEGIGSCWVSQIEREKVKEMLSIPKELHLLTVLPFGYPLEEKVTRKKDRKPFEEVAFREKLGLKF